MDKGLIEVILLKEHTDNGRVYQKGDKLKVDVKTAEWLKAQQVVAGKLASTNDEENT